MKKYKDRMERASIRLPTELKNLLWQQAELQQVSATDVVVRILWKAFEGLPPAPLWEKGRLNVVAIRRKAEATRLKRLARAKARAEAKAAKAAAEDKKQRQLKAHRKKRVSPSWAGDKTTGVFE